MHKMPKLEQNRPLATVRRHPPGARTAGQSSVGVETELTVLLCDTQPLLIEGVKTLLRECSDLKLIGATTSLGAAADIVTHLRPQVVVVDKTFGLPAIAQWIGSYLAEPDAPALIVWGTSIARPEARKLMKAGAVGIISKSAVAEDFLHCIRSAGAHNSWVEEPEHFLDNSKEHHPRTRLTSREQQVLEFVECGMKNRQIAGEMGIRPATVKVHLNHIYDKTGIRSRFDLALAGLRRNGSRLQCPSH